MSMEQIVNIIVNNGIGVGALVFMAYYINGSMKDVITTLNEINKALASTSITLQNVTDRLERLEHKIEDLK